MFAAYWPSLLRRIQRADVVNVHGAAPTFSDLCLRFIRRLPEATRPAVVYTHHAPIAIPRLERLCEVYNGLHRSLARSAELIVATSRHYAALHAGPGGPPVHLVPWGVELPARTRDKAEAFDRGPLRVLFVGQLRPYKGVDVLLRAAAGCDFIELTIVGSGSKASAYQRLAAAESSANVSFKGWLSDEELAAEYARNDVVVLPSVTRAEAFGLVLLEGMIAGCVPVASDLPGVRDLVGDAGVCVPIRDAAALRDALLRLALSPQLRSALSERAVRRATSMTWDVCVDSYLSAFEIAVWRRKAAARRAGSQSDRRSRQGGLALVGRAASTPGRRLRSVAERRSPVDASAVAAG